MRRQPKTVAYNHSKQQTLQCLTTQFSPQQKLCAERLAAVITERTQWIQGSHNAKYASDAFPWI